MTVHNVNIQTDIVDLSKERRRSKGLDMYRTKVKDGKLLETIMSDLPAAISRLPKTKAAAAGSLAVGALAVGAVALGALAIGRLMIGHARIRRLEIDELLVRKLRISESVESVDIAQTKRDGTP
jgi:hypothetical protein